MPGYVSRGKNELAGHRGSDEWPSVMIILAQLGSAQLSWKLPREALSTDFLRFGQAMGGQARQAGKAPSVLMRPLAWRTAPCRSMSQSSQPPASIWVGEGHELVDRDI
jgi:hypothetical protein